MKKLIYLLLIFVLLVVFPSCDTQDSTQHESRKCSVNIVNKADVPLTIESIEFYETYDYNSYSFLDEIIVDYELLSERNKRIDYTHEYTYDNYTSGPNLCVKLNCTYNGNSVPAAGGYVGPNGELAGQSLLAERYYFLVRTLQLDFGKYTNYESETVYAIVESR